MRGEQACLAETQFHFSYAINVHTAEEIQAVREILPHLGPLSRAMKINDILIYADGDIKSKYLPSDFYHGHVKTTLS